MSFFVSCLSTYSRALSTDTHQIQVGDVILLSLLLLRPCRCVALWNSPLRPSRLQKGRLLSLGAPGDPAVLELLSGLGHCGSGEGQAARAEGRPAGQALGALRGDLWVVKSILDDLEKRSFENGII